MRLSVRRLAGAAALTGFVALAFASPQVAGDAPCALDPVGIESFATCASDRVVRPADERYAALAPDKRTKLGLYVAAEDAHRLKLERGDSVLLIDVRSHGEREMSGIANESDVHVAFGSEESPVGSGAAFVDGVARVIAARSGSRDDDIVLLSEDGTVSAKAADALADAGYTRVFSVVDGFDGEALVDGRMRRGWRNSALPWQTWRNATGPQP